MTSHVPSLPPVSGLVPRGPAAGRAPSPGPGAPPAAQPVDRVELRGDATIPAAPPAEVLDELHVAGRVVAELHARGRELRFASDPDSGRIVVEVRDLDGNVLRRIPPSDALRVASGDLEI
jgi:FlaG protein